MSRAIDKFPDPPVKRPTKIIGMGCSRTATLGLYKALSILGYNTLHMIVIINGDIGGKHHDPKIFYEALESHNNPNSGIKPYTRADFEKWWAEYDVSSKQTAFVPPYGVMPSKKLTRMKRPSWNAPATSQRPSSKRTRTTRTSSSS